MTVQEVREPARLTRPERSVSRHLDDAHYQRIAACSWLHGASGHPPRQTVTKQMGGAEPVPLATLDRWIAEAKRRGHLRRDWRTTTELDG